MRLEAKDIRFRYTAKTPDILSGLSFSVEEGERVGIVAPSGCGKTTLVHLLAGYERPTQGQVLLNGTPLAKKGALPVQLIPQQPERAINPRWRMATMLAEAGPPREELLGALGIEAAWLGRYPRELSGGELQRFCVARALLAAPRFLLADEMSSMLDGITQAQIWRYLLAEVESREIGLVVVSHNPALIKRVCSRVVRLSDINHAGAL